MEIGLIIFISKSVFSSSFDHKVGCVFSMVIWSEFRIWQYRDDDHHDDASHFTRERACSTSLVTYLKCFTKHLKNLLKSFPMVLDRSLQTLVDIKDKSPLKVILEMDFKIFSYKIIVFNLYKSISIIGSISTGANLMICQFKWASRLQKGQIFHSMDRLHQWTSKGPVQVQV